MITERRWPSHLRNQLVKKPPHEGVMRGLLRMRVCCCCFADVVAFRTGVTCNACLTFIGCRAQDYVSVSYSNRGGLGAFHLSPLVFSSACFSSRWAVNLRQPDTGFPC